MSEIQRVFSVIIKEKLAFKNCKISYLGAKSADKLLHSCKIFKLKSIQCIRLKFLRTINRATPFHNSELMFCNSIRKGIAFTNKANIVNKDSSTKL